MDDERLKKSIDPARVSRVAEDRATTEDRILSDDDRLDMFRQQFHQAALPDLPNIPGYHVCWLTTTNPRDPVHGRIRLGYEPIRAEEVPGWEYASLKTGDWSGCIGVNEMLAFKLPLSLYQRFMQEAHHDAPAREEGKLTETADFLRQQAQAAGGNVIEGDGLQDLRRNVQRPTFLGQL